MGAGDDREARYKDILRRIEQRKREQAAAPRQANLSAVLDALGAMGMLDTLQRRPPAEINVYGPDVFRGERDGRQWAGVVVWYKAAGYYHHQTLGLLGIWAVEGTDGTAVAVATRYLHYNAPVFNPESYYHHIRRKFDLFYEGDASPPEVALAPQSPLHEGEGEAGVLYRAVYDPARRLEQRGEVERAVREWAGGVNLAGL